MQIVPSSDVESECEAEAKQKEIKQEDKDGGESVENFNSVEQDEKSLLLDNQWSVRCTDANKCAFVWFEYIRAKRDELLYT